MQALMGNRGHCLQPPCPVAAAIRRGPRSADLAAKRSRRPAPDRLVRKWESPPRARAAGTRRGARSSGGSLAPAGYAQSRNLLHGRWPVPRWPRGPRREPGQRDRDNHEGRAEGARVRRGARELDEVKPRKRGLGLAFAAALTLFAASAPASADYRKVIRDCAQD